MKNANKPISPCMMQKVGDDDYRASKNNDPKEWNVATEGLTKREYFAAKALQGLCAGRTEYENPMVDANKAVELADLLLVALANES